MFSYPEAPAVVPSSNLTDTSVARSSRVNFENEDYADDMTPRRIDSYLQKNGFERSLVEPSLYMQKRDADFLVACLYVDDLIYTSTSKLLLEKFKKAMMDEFEMTDLGLMKYFLGLQVKQSKGEIIISQEKYVANILKKFRMENAKAVATPMALNEKLQQDDGAEMFDSKIYRSLVARVDDATLAPEYCSIPELEWVTSETEWCSRVLEPNGDDLEHHSARAH
ncbi:hypothetical protein ZIOFF_070583 [Zingiber officinale]|uniref:Reverse transcriptase Ty1/copia-type domain-containing protein n=1 Tax=Zingiber officinale TaxID=94328 RepID=A0A8J5EPZ5_ZINOF|nr:hypothetical protein ZIOFF_070583 [Zingiber officinale]